MKRRHLLTNLGAVAFAGCAGLGTDETATTETTGTPTRRPTGTATTTDPPATDSPETASPGSDATESASEQTTPADADYRTIRVEAGERRGIRVESGETLENVLVDMTAEGASAQIVATGTDWTVRNVGFAGVHPGGHYLVIAAAEEGTTGTFENVYMGDGQVAGTPKGGIWLRSTHRGTIEWRRVNVQRFVDNGLYGTDSTRDSGGVVNVSDSYFRSNNDANIRVGTAAGTCTVRNTVSVGDTTTPVSDHHAGEHGHGGQCRGVWAWYGKVLVEDCDIAVDESVGANLVEADATEAAAGADIVTRNTRVGEQADTDPPSGVPLTAEEAARGGSGN